MTEAVASETRSQNEFLCVDSAPKQFASFIPIWRAPAVCLSFLAISFSLLFLINQVPLLNDLFPDDDLIFSRYEGTHAIPVRLFIISFSASFCCFCNGDARNKLYLFTDIFLSYALYCAIFDLISICLNEAFQIVYPLSFIEIFSGLLGFWVFSLKLLRRGRMPSKIKVPYKPQRTYSTLIRLIGSAAVAAAFSVWVASLDLTLVEDLRNFALLGGIGPGVFLFLPVLFTVWFGLATYDRMMMRTGDFSPPLTFVVPAHNEEYIIADTIFAMDEAACNYKGDVIILIMNNNSEDRTKEIAEAALNKCKAATGRVIDVPKPGKSNALNAGLEATETEYFVRVDADTLIAPDSIHRAMRYFFNPKVGVVGGLPIPPGGALFDNARFLEVIVKHGYYSVALGAINGVVGVPGMLALYRTELPRKLGGFVEGMNGEDTDMSLRIGEMGYEVVVDPKVTYISEVPASYKHMREQRMRWFRSIYHISSRNGDYLDRSWLTIRGKIILPYMLINSARRAMLTPLVLFGAIEYATHFNSANTLKWQAVLAVLIGAPAIVAIFATLINGYPKGVFALPDYLIFRAIRAYLTLESLLSIIIAPDPKIVEREARNRMRRVQWTTRAKAALAGAALSIGTIFNVNAAGEDLTATLISGVDRKGLVIQEDEVVMSDLMTGVVGDATIAYKRRMRKSDFLVVSGGILHERYFGDASLNSFRYRGQVQYRRRFSGLCNCWLQVTPRIEMKQRDGEGLFRRESAQANFNISHSRRHSSRVWFDGSNLDYDDARLEGFDQRSYRSAFSQQYRAPKAGLKIQGLVFVEKSDADEARFDFTSVGAQFRSTYDISNAQELYADLRWREREYGDFFSSAFPVRRNDTRFSGVIGGKRNISKRLKAVAEIGWESNASTIPIRDYSGIRFRVALEARIPIKK